MARVLSRTARNRARSGIDLERVADRLPPRVAAVHVLRVEFAGARIKVALDGKTYIEAQDSRIGGPGAVGVWTKADSVTSFDDFSYGN